MLTAGLALLLLCGEGSRLFGLSPLLAGMAAGFTIVNRAHRDIRLFRALNAFEAPIYVLFFTSAGIHFDFSALLVAGWLGLAYLGLRSFGKIIGAGVGGRFSRAPTVVQKYLGLSLVPQAGVAIGLLFLINDDPSVRIFAGFITPVVLTGVVLSELIGPVCAKFALNLR
jgi:Kef-type K+ transport system membrane component KefB